MMKDRKRLGETAEAFAANHLKAKGYKILAQNYRCRHGEIDIIALDNRTLVFIEVRARGSMDFGLPQESVGYRKQRKLREVARYYLATERGKGGICRFDVVAVQYDSENQRVRKIEHIENAF
ncbi:MAG TPA: YraN family protein [Desulfotomaculum sp.]|nr:YraN family protein [Desulfotomaculum sp.]